MMLSSIKLPPTYLYGFFAKNGKGSSDFLQLVERNAVRGETIWVMNAAPNEMRDGPRRQFREVAHGLSFEILERLERLLFQGGQKCPGATISMTHLSRCSSSPARARVVRDEVSPSKCLCRSPPTLHPWRPLN